MYNFTLIIPTHNRHEYINRSVEYYKDIDANVIYCDSSSSAYIAKKQYSNIKYIHLRDRKFAEKILIVLNKYVTTKFVALCADDDFILTEALYQGAEILEKGKQYSTVLGKHIAFNEDFDGNFYKLYKNPPDDLTFAPEVNAQLFFKDYYQILWAMYKKEILIIAFSIINKANFKNDNFIEMVIGACCCNYGGVKFLESIWGVREISSSNHWGKRHKNIENITDKAINNDYLKFKELLDLNTNPGYSDIVMNSYLKKAYTNRLKKYIITFLPHSLIVKIKYLMFWKRKEEKKQIYSATDNKLDIITRILQVK